MSLPIRGETRMDRPLHGHSDGGQNVRLFASLDPEEVAGLVLVDA